MGLIRVRLVLLAIAGLLALAAPAGAASQVGVYVALGDSYTAGPLVPNPTGDPIDCGRSDHNYPSLVATAIRPAEFRDVSCGSAQTKDMTAPQTGLPLGGTNPPQFNALDSSVDLVTLGIGGNDMGFGGIVETCAELGIQSSGQGHPCSDHYHAGGVDEIAQRLDEKVGPAITRVIDGIHERAPNARLVVVGYPDPVPQPPGCYPVVPIAAGDLPYLHLVAHNLSATVVDRARAGGAEFVDLLDGSAGHDICQLPPKKWYEGIVPTSPAYPAHPNALGMEFAARQVLATLAHPVPNRVRIIRKRRASSGRVVLRVRAPARGAVTATAHGYRKANAFAERAGAVRLTLKPRGHKPHSGRVKVKVRFAPVGGDPRTVRASIR
ncbi:MAG: SGNH/GDSL hydrolase family protein [Solirubrobacterales bacterium]